jgi:hypothetical protein
MKNVTLSRVESVFVRGAAKDDSNSQLNFVGPPVGRHVDTFCTNKPKVMPGTSKMASSSSSSNNSANNVDGGTHLFVSIVAGASSVVMLVIVASVVLLCK